MAFWGIFVPTNILGAALLASAERLHKNSEQILLLTAAWAIDVAIILFSSIALWRCSRNTSETLWKHLARIYLVIIWLLPIHHLAPHV